uniref:PPPDE domain-containing protein n=1 Tax=Meloidogyne javanica TaxID=6303 RepID=A0A915N910_MELJA
MFKQKFPAIFIIFFLVNYSLETEVGESSGIETRYDTNNNNELTSEEVEDLIERIEILKPYAERVSEKVAIKMNKEFEKYPEKYHHAFDEEIFKTKVKENKSCGEIKIAAYELFKNSTKVGVFHSGVFVCGIEIHFHRPGLEYWKPKHFHTRFNGGHFKQYDGISIKNENGGSRTAQTNLSFAQIVKVIDSNFAEDYTKETYNVITNNCLKFARELISKIADKEENEHFVWPTSVIFPLKKPFKKGMKMAKKFTKKL